MNFRSYGIYSVLAAFAATACSSSNGDAPPAPPPPAAQAEKPACVISADCPAGAHCDLSECVQDCNERDACTGELTCSPRARCVPPGSPDQDPPPPATHLGDVKVTPSAVALTGDDHTFQVQLTSSSAAPVRYRVQLHAPHLAIDNPRGEFTTSTTLTIKVDPSKLKGRDVGGSVKIFTTLGNVVVDAPIHVGLTGAYRGALRYDGGTVSLGDTRIALELIEKNGDVTARIDSKSSLLFPGTGTGETTGRGSFTVSGGLDLTVQQVIDAAFGGGRNHFGRAIGRRIRLKMKPGDRGGLQGTFAETVYGLFSEPITVTGTVALEYQAHGQDPSFTLANDLTMPPSPSKDSTLGPDKVFGWSVSSCDWLLDCGGRRCKAGVDPNCDCNNDPQLCESAPACGTPAMLAAESTYAKPLQDMMTLHVNGTSSPFDAIASACSANLALTSDTLPPGQKGCGLVAPLACAVQIGAGAPVSDKANAKLVGTLVNEALAAPLLVAKDHIVHALNDSFALGLSAERDHYAKALTALGPVTTWMAQPRILEFLRSIDSDAAKGEVSGTSSRTDSYPAGRALADLFSTLAVIDGERARMDAAASRGNQPQVADDAQHRAVLGYLEAVALAEILRAWQTSPPSIASKFIGVLNPLDRGFAAILQGANAFGVPVGFVPFVYRPEDVAKGPTNFEQMLGIASQSVNAEKNVEATFTANKRAYEASQAQLQSTLSSVRGQYDIKLKEICGAAFDPNAVKNDRDWAACGGGSDQNAKWIQCSEPTKPVTGEVGSLLLDIKAANCRVDSSLSRLHGMSDKIKISKRTLAARLRIQENEIQFIDSNGQEIEALTLASGLLDTAMKSIQVAANANVLNFGAPVAEAGGEEVLGVLKSGVDAAKVGLQTAQTMHAAQTSANIDRLNSEAEIEKEEIDLAQLSVDLHQDLLGVVQAELRARNLVAHAHVLFEERARLLSIADRDPTNDPSFRLLRDEDALMTLKARADAQTQLYLAASALEYELNMSIPAIDGAVMNAHNGTSLDMLDACLLSIYNSSRVAYGSPQDYVTTVSVRKMLGVIGPRTDAVTGQALSEGDQFRQLLLRNENIDGRGGVGIVFATDLQPGNQLWSTDVCSDRIATVQAQLVGDFLGDNQAQVNLMLAGGGVMRACDSDALHTWSFGSAANATSAFGVIQGGVNTFGDAPPNNSLFGQPVARASWTLVIPGGSDAPSNADVDITHIDDVVLKFAHKALPRRGSPVSVDLSCLANIR